MFLRKRKNTEFIASRENTEKPVVKATIQETKKKQEAKPHKSTVKKEAKQEIVVEEPATQE